MSGAVVCCFFDAFVRVVFEAQYKVKALKFKGFGDVKLRVIGLQGCCKGV